MSFKQFDRFSVRMESLAARDNKKRIENDHVSVDAPAPSLPDASLKMIDDVSLSIRELKLNLELYDKILLYLHFK